MPKRKENNNDTIGNKEKEIESYLKELLGVETKMNRFSLHYISSSDATKDSIDRNVAFLTLIGIEEDKIIRYAYLVAIDEKELVERYRFLKDIGISEKNIRSYPFLLGKDIESLRRNYQLLKSFGLSDSSIANYPQLLSLRYETIEEKYRYLESIGMKIKKTKKYPQILARSTNRIREQVNFLKELLDVKEDEILPQLLLLNRERIEKNYEFLRRMGISKEKIAKHQQLLMMKIETIENKYKELNRLGISKKKIASQPQLLMRDVNTLERNYQHAVRLFREDYNDRNCGRNILTQNPQLLELSPKILEENVYFLSYLGIDYREFPILLGTKPYTKREKMAWMLRELFDYDSTESLENKRNTIKRLYDFLRDNPKLLGYSISRLEREKDKLKNIANKYRDLK